MRPFTDYNSVSAYTNTVKLPAGAYKVRIIRAEEQPGENNSCALCILFDIAEGEFKNYFMNKFNSDKKAYPDTAKYKGVFRLWYPNGNEYDENNKRRMKTALAKICESNNLTIDFTKEWDGAVFKGCNVGMIFRDEEYDYKGYQGFNANPYGFITLSDLKEGKFNLPEAKYLDNPITTHPQASQSFEDMPLVDDLPF